MKVFIAGTSFALSYGGPAFSVPRLAAAVAAAGVNVYLWAPDGSAGISAVASRSAARLTLLGGSLDDALVVCGQPDVVHDNGLWLPHNHCIAVATARRKIPRIVSTRGMLEPWAIRHKWIKKAIAWRLYQRRDLVSATFLHATAEAEAESIRSRGVDVPIVTIANGADLPDLADLRPFHPDAADGLKGERIALFISRIHPKKGLPLLINAWARLRPPGWRLRIIGPDEGGHTAEVAALVGQYGLGSVVKFERPVQGKSKTEAYRSADLFVLPTHSENFGMVVAEALAHGVPVLTTRGAPWPELETKRCGWWVDPTVECILAGLAAATTTPPSALREMGERGRALIADRYGWEPIAQQFLTTYERAMSRARDRARA